MIASHDSSDSPLFMVIAPNAPHEPLNVSVLLIVKTQHAQNAVTSFYCYKIITKHRAACRNYIHQFFWLKTWNSETFMGIW